MAKKELSHQNMTWWWWVSLFRIASRDIDQGERYRRSAWLLDIIAKGQILYILVTVQKPPRTMTLIISQLVSDASLVQ